ncbi:protein of unknown function [Pseudodesulfovibrio piezophilus C1TLV30]|uniref:Uncharacterized protein n=1 Tax=Pseudodesulfovibrio piezophilus (strain DSM 21447 / JCM 15486 / C1TLV30) TaxID=1322246 RepID=M1WJR6_PSEP2|nr:protein of unknown function [Pseudodesulfovibrio piezophilus C1TLV30]
MRLVLAHDRLGDLPHAFLVLLVLNLAVCVKVCQLQEVLEAVLADFCVLPEGHDAVCGVDGEQPERSLYEIFVLVRHGVHGIQAGVKAEAFEYERERGLGVLGVRQKLELGLGGRLHPVVDELAFRDGKKFFHGRVLDWKDGARGNKTAPKLLVGLDVRQLFDCFFLAVADQVVVHLEQHRRAGVAHEGGDSLDVGLVGDQAGGEEVTELVGGHLLADVGLLHGGPERLGVALHGLASVLDDVVALRRGLPALDFLKELVAQGDVMVAPGRLGAANPYALVVEVHVAVLDLEQLTLAGAAACVQDQLDRFVNVERRVILDGFDVFRVDVQVTGLLSLHHALSPSRHRVLFDVLELHAEVEHDVEVRDVAVKRTGRQVGVLKCQHVEVLGLELVDRRVVEGWQVGLVQPVRHLLEELPFAATGLLVVEIYLAELVEVDVSRPDLLAAFLHQVDLCVTLVGRLLGLGPFAEVFLLRALAVGDAVLGVPASVLGDSD